jgi:hypothetical protein
VTKVNNISSIPDLYNIGVSVQKSEEEIEYLLQSYVRELESSLTKTSEPLVYERNLDIFDFLGLVKLCIQSRQDTEGVPKQNRINFLENNPPKVIDTETIAFELVMRKPGQFDRAPLGMGKIREVTPHVRSVIQHPSIPGKRLITYGKFYENIIRFYCYAKETRNALNRVLWFEKVMDSYYWCFRLHGFTPIEDGVGEKEIINIGESNFVRYPVSYIIRTDDTFHVSEQELRSIVLDFNVSK